MLSAKPAKPFTLSRGAISYGHVAVGKSSSVVVEVCNHDDKSHTITARQIELSDARQPDETDFSFGGFNTDDTSNGFKPSGCKDVSVKFKPHGEGLRAAKFIVQDEFSSIYEVFLIGEAGNRSPLIITDVQARFDRQ